MISAQLLFNPQLIAEMVQGLYRNVWVIGINKTEEPLYTSDNPMVKDHVIKDPLNAGWISEGVQIAFPLTPKHILLLFDRTVFLEHSHLDCQHMFLVPDNISYYNSLQVIHSHRQVYCSSESFELAERVCRDKPEICKPKDKRVRVHHSDLREGDEPGQLKQTVVVQAYSEDE